jgi:hypothetical protein
MTYDWKRKVTFYDLVLTEVFGWPKRQPAQGQGGKIAGIPTPSTQAPPRWGWQPYSPHSQVK